MLYQLLISFILLILPLFFYIIIIKNTKTNKPSSPRASNILPKSYPLVGSFFALLANRHRFITWTASVIQNLPSATFVSKPYQVITGNPANVRHILKTHFHNYPKGKIFRTALFDFLGDGIFNADGDNWKFQRQVSSHEFNTKSLRKFVETVVETELSDRLIPILSAAAANKTVLDFQDILQRFAFDNICKIAFGDDPEYLLPSLPETEFARAFDEATYISGQRLQDPLPIIWKIERLLKIGSQKHLQAVVSHVNEFAQNIMRVKKKELTEKSSAAQSMDLLTRFLSSGQYDDNFVRDIVISFILAGRDTTSAALTWFFWLLSRYPEVEAQILKEIKEKNTDAFVLEDIKDMVYTHASLSESMRLYPPVPADSKLAENNDVWPDGTFIKKGTVVVYHPYAMGRMESIWGSDWAEYKPERWLKREEGKWIYVGRGPYTYPVFQAGPRICLGKDMAYLQMKMVVAGVLKRFRVLPAMEEGFEPEYVGFLTSKMKGGFPVRIEEKSE